MYWGSDVLTMSRFCQSNGGVAVDHFKFTVEPYGCHHPTIGAQTINTMTATYAGEEPTGH